MTQVLETLNMPSRAEIVSIAERMTNIEMRLDDMDAKLDGMQTTATQSVRPEVSSEPVRGQLARIEAKLREPGRMNVLQAMCKTSPADAGAQLANVKCPVLIIEGSADPDRTWVEGGSAGGYVVLCALTFEPEAFAAGVSLFGATRRHASASKSRNNGSVTRSSRTRAKFFPAVWMQTRCTSRNGSSARLGISRRAVR